MVLQYEEVKGVGVDITTTTTVSTEFAIGVSQRDRAANTVGIDSMCTVPIVRFLPFTTEFLIGSTHATTMSGDSPQKSYGKQQLFNTIYSVVCMYGCMYFRLHVLQYISHMFCVGGRCVEAAFRVGT